MQLDRVLAALTTDARGNLQTLVRGLGASLSGQPTAAQDAAQDQDSSVRGLTAAQALNKSLKYSAGAFKASAIVNEALLGTQPHDLSEAVQGNEEVFRALASRQSQLASLVTTFDATLKALASRQHDLSATIAALRRCCAPPTAHLTALDALFGPTKTFAKEILPGVEQLDPTIGQALPWLAQATALLEPSELGGLVSDLTPAIQATASTIHSSTALVSQSNALARCVTHNLVPTGNTVIQDPPLTSGVPVYQELLESAVGIAGAGQDFDGNGRYLRSLGGGRLGRGPDRRARLAGTAVRQCRTRAARHPPRVAGPRATGQERHSVLPERGARPEPREYGGRAMSGRAGATGVGDERASRPTGRTSWRSWLLVAGALAVAAYILYHQPSFTFGQSYYTVQAEFASSAAVTPGQGQAVTIAGVQVGLVGGVSSRTGGPW